MTSEYKVLVAPRAERDLNDIQEYIRFELKNISAARNVADEIERVLSNLGNMPQKYPMSDISELRKEGYRKCVVHNYIALYKIDEKRKAIIVTNIFNGIRDYKNLNIY